MMSHACAITEADAGQTLAAWLRKRFPEHSWTAVKRLIATRHVRIDGELCLDDARRLKAGQHVEVLPRPMAKPRQHEAIALRHVDAHLVVIEKPAGISSVRHPTERDWPKQRKELSPTLEDVVPKLLALREGKATKGTLPRLRIVQRLDKETSGLLVMARTVVAERGLGKQFHAHTVLRRYTALVAGKVAPQTIRSHLVRDRGDGRRGSTQWPDQGKEAVTHVDVQELLPAHSLIWCRLETGRTHQIRIHLAELGHPVCGEKVYAPPQAEGPSRLFLHAAELGFVHPVTEAPMAWQMPLPGDLQAYLDRLRTPRS